MARNNIEYYSKSGAIAERPPSALGVMPARMKIFIIFMLLSGRPSVHRAVDNLAPQRWCYVFTKPENKK
jgi:hypothetical protein